MQKVSALFLIFCFNGVLFTQAHALERVIQISNGAASPGNTTVLELGMDQVQDFAGGDFEIYFDSAFLHIVDVDRTECTDSFLLVDGNPSPGLLTISMAAAEGIPAGTHAAIAEVVVQVLPTVQQDALTALTFKTAHWYDENSIRHSYVADNGLVRASGTVPPEEALRVQAGASQGGPGVQVDVPLTLSVVQGVASIQGSVQFDSTALEDPDFFVNEAFPDWQENHTVVSDQMQFLLEGPSELSGLSTETVAQMSFVVSQDATPGIQVPLTLSEISVKNSDEFPFLAEALDGQVDIEQQTDTPTPSATPTETACSPADFNEDGIVDATDLLQFVSTWHEETESQ